MRIATPHDAGARPHLSAVLTHPHSWCTVHPPPWHVLHCTAAWGARRGKAACGGQRIGGRVGGERRRWGLRPGGLRALPRLRRHRSGRQIGAGGAAERPCSPLGRFLGPSDPPALVRQLAPARYSSFPSIESPQIPQSSCPSASSVPFGSWAAGCTTVPCFRPMVKSRERRACAAAGSRPAPSSSPLRSAASRPDLNHWQSISAPLRSGVLQCSGRSNAQGNNS